MTAPNTKDIVDSFTEKVTRNLDAARLDGPIRLDNTRTVVIIPVKGRGPIHAHIQAGIDDEGVENVLAQIEAVPSLKGLVVRG